MGKKVVRPTESDLREIVREIVWSFANEHSIPRQPIDEAILYSYPARRVLLFISEKYHLVTSERKFNRVAGCDGIIKLRNEKNHCEVILLAVRKDKPNLRNAIIKDMETCCGWFCAKPFDPNVSGYEGWQFERKPDDNFADDLVYQRNYIYHICPKSRLNKILSVGLIPKRTTWAEYQINNIFYRDKNGTDYGWKTVDRVYAFLDTPTRGFLKSNNFNEKEIVTDGYVLLRIDTSKIQSQLAEERPHFYSDPRADGCVFCVSNIPKEALTVIQ